MTEVAPTELVPLLVASSRFADPGERRPLDRIRIQRAVFLVQMDGPPEWRHLFEWGPYDRGAYSFGLERVLADLCDRGLLGAMMTDRPPIRTYVTTRAGDAVVDEHLVHLSPLIVEVVQRSRRFVMSPLLTRAPRMYRRFPDLRVCHWMR